MNIEEKPWDSFVLFAPEKMMEQDTEDYYFYGTDEYRMFFLISYMSKENG